MINEHDANMAGTVLGDARRFLELLLHTIPEVALLLQAFAIASLALLKALLKVKIASVATGFLQT
jgi:hypothetical protein